MPNSRSGVGNALAAWNMSSQKARKSSRIPRSCQKDSRVKRLPLSKLEQYRSINNNNFKGLEYIKYI